MRCYLMRDGHIEAVEFLHAADDPGRIAEARQAFLTKGKEFRADSYEVWEGARFIYRFPEAPAPR